MSPELPEIAPCVATIPCTTVSGRCGRIAVQATVVPAGNDLCVVLTGGDQPHIGCVSLSQSRPSLADVSRVSATTSVLNLLGHKDGEVAEHMGRQLATTLRATVVVTGGIHLEAITPAEIKTVRTLIQKLTEALIAQLCADRTDRAR
ncbi:MAG: hypothetical protein ACOX5Z_01610 [Desulfobulbus sp.]|jgi:hypothetical protein